jgi:hypothetical protein
MVGLEEVTWKDKKIPLTEESKFSTDSKQTTLSDFSIKHTWGGILSYWMP